MNIDDKLVLVRKSDFLAKLTDADYEQLNLAHNVVTATRNNYIYFESAQLNKLYFVKEGFIKIGYIDDGGKETIREVLEPGDIFGQITLEQENMAKEFAQAFKSDVSLCSFTVTDFSRLLTLRPDLAIHYTKKVGRQLHRLQNRLQNLLQKDVRSRLLHFIWGMVAHRSHQLVDNKLSIPNHLTHQDVARLIGSTRQSVSEVITQLTQDGLIQVSRKEIKIIDFNLLQKMVNQL